MFNFILGLMIGRFIGIMLMEFYICIYIIKVKLLKRIIREGDTNCKKKTH